MRPPDPEDAAPDTLTTSLVPLRDRDAISEAFDVVQRAERETRRSWAQLSASEPWTAGTAARARRLTQSLQQLLDGEGSRFARAVRAQQAPWYLDEDPLKGVLSRAAILTTQADELCQIVDSVRRYQQQLGDLHLKVGGELPRAWDRWFTRRGLSTESLETILSLDELRVVRTSLSFGIRRLVAWRRELTAWLRQEEASSPSRSLMSVESREMPMPSLEARYEMLLRLGRIDRGSQQARNAAHMRQRIADHLLRLGDLAGARTDDPAFLLSLDYLSNSTLAEVTSEESRSYRDCIAHFHKRALNQIRDG